MRRVVCVLNMTGRLPKRIHTLFLIVPPLNAFFNREVRVGVGVEVASIVEKE